jgi:transmembrane sensor
VDELICRTLQGRTSRAERDRLLAWRRDSPENERYYSDLVRLLEEATAAELSEEADSMPLIEDLIAPSPFSTFRKRRRGWSRSRLLAATSTLTAAAAILLFLFGSRPASQSLAESSFGTGEIVTGHSESTTVRLGDGTIVRLGPESRLRVIGEAGRREVWMEGRAYFAVARDEARPFRIRTHAGDALVLGTRFDLHVRNDDLRVLVVEGAVQLGARGSAVDVEASQLGRVTAYLPPSREEVDAEFIETELSWIGNFIAFENTPLSRAAQELSAHYGVPVEVLDSSLARETVRGMFTDETLPEVVRVLCRATGAHCSITPTGVTIGP